MIKSVLSALILSLPAASSNIEQIQVQVENIADYEEQLPPCFYTRSCGDYYEPAPRSPGYYQETAPPRNPDYGYYGPKRYYDFYPGYSTDPRQWRGYVR